MTPHDANPRHTLQTSNKFLEGEYQLEFFAFAAVSSKESTLIDGVVLLYLCIRGIVGESRCVTLETTWSSGRSERVKATVQISFSLRFSERVALQAHLQWPVRQGTVFWWGDQRVWVVYGPLHVSRTVTLFWRWTVAASVPLQPSRASQYCK